MKEKKIKIADDVKYEFSSDWIKSLETKNHWQLYWFQQKLLQEKLEVGDKVLEVGLGSGFCANYLKSKGVNVKTIDIDKDKNPDIVANIVDYKLKNYYKHILAFEVFEHIPYEKFISTLGGLKSKCKYIYMSMPLNRRKLIDFSLWLPKIHNLNFLFTLPKNKITEKHHFWEVGYKDFKKQKILDDIENKGYRVITEAVFQLRLFLVIENQK